MHILNMIINLEKIYSKYHGKQSGSMKHFYDIAFIMYRRNGEVDVYFNEG